LKRLGYRARFLADKAEESSPERWAAAVALVEADSVVEVSGVVGSVEVDLAGVAVDEEATSADSIRDNRTEPSSGWAAIRR